MRKSRSLVVQYAGGGAALKLLLLQNALKVLHALVQVPHVSWQVAVEETDGVTKHGHPGADTTFITLGIQREGGANREKVTNTTDALLEMLFCFPGLSGSTI